MERAGQELPTLNNTLGRELLRRPATVASIPGKLQHEAADELWVMECQFDRHLAAERITYKGCTLQSDLVHPGSQRIRELANGERLRRLFAQAEAGQIWRLYPDMEARCFANGIM